MFLFRFYSRRKVRMQGRGEKKEECSGRVNVVDITYTFKRRGKSGWGGNKFCPLDTDSK